MPQALLAIVSSIAAFVPLPDSPSYCASKSAVLAYGLSLRSLLKPYGVRVSWYKTRNQSSYKLLMLL